MENFNPVRPGILSGLPGRGRDRATRAAVPADSVPDSFLTRLTMTDRHQPARSVDDEIRAGADVMPRSPGAEGLLSIDRDIRETIEVLVVDDEHTLRESCASILRADGFPVTVCARGEEAVELLQRRRFDIILLDLYLPKMSGMDVLEVALKESPDTLVLVMTGNPSVESSIQALRAGAWDYIPKPFSATHLKILMGRAAHTVLVSRESETARGQDGGDNTSLLARTSSGALLGESRGFRQVVELARRVAPTDASVFITGESGTGKEVIAQFIHANSRRSSRELVPVNCAALPDTLLESEMFGHMEGAFTGAVREKKGLLEVAHGGTLFLDELTEMPHSIQAKLLRVIQDGVVRRVGSTRTDAVVNVRFIAATNQDPSEAIRQNKLRRDLHYRLRVVPIHIPPLRSRPEDIPILAEHFLAEFWKQHRGRREKAPVLSRSALDALVASPWRGNVRELRNVMEHAAVLLPPGGEVGPDDIPFIDDEAGFGGGGGFLAPFRFTDDYHTAREQVLAEFEKRYLEHVIRRANGNISDAARIGGVDRTTLYRLMEKHGTHRDNILDD